MHWLIISYHIESPFHISSFTSNTNTTLFFRYQCTTGKSGRHHFFFHYTLGIEKTLVFCIFLNQHLPPCSSIHFFFFNFFFLWCSSQHQSIHNSHFSSNSPHTYAFQSYQPAQLFTHGQFKSQTSQVGQNCVKNG